LPIFGKGVKNIITNHDNFPLTLTLSPRGRGKITFSNTPKGRGKITFSNTPKGRGKIAFDNTPKGREDNF